MNRIEAISAIFSRSANDRLQAARVLRAHAVDSDLSVIKLALGSERVPWVRSALERARERLEGASAPQTIGLEQRSTPDEDVTHKTIGQVLHELTPAIGRLKMVVMKEFDGYEDSKTKKEFEKIAELVDLFSRWRRVNSPPRYSAVALSELISEVVDDESTSGVPVAVQQDARVPEVMTDREYLKAAVANGLRNAIQAIEDKSVARIGTEGVTISYGSTDKEFWISIIDEGVGLPANSEVVFASSTTTKPGHSGLGLPIARDAISKLGGRLSLTPALPTGAKFLIEVPLQVSLS